MKAKRAGRVQSQQEQWRLRRFASRDRSFSMQCNPAVARCRSARLHAHLHAHLHHRFTIADTLETRTRRRETTARWVADGSGVPWPSEPVHVYIFRALAGSAFQTTSNDLLRRHRGHLDTASVGGEGPKTCSVGPQDWETGHKTRAILSPTHVLLACSPTFPKGQVSGLNLGVLARWLNSTGEVLCRGAATDRAGSRSIPILRCAAGLLAGDPGLAK